MFKKMLLSLTSIGAVGGLTVYLLTIPMLRRLPKQDRVSVDGITTIDNAAQHVYAFTNSQCSVTIRLIGALLDKEC